VLPFAVISSTPTRHLFDPFSLKPFLSQSCKYLPAHPLSFDTHTNARGMASTVTTLPTLAANPSRICSEDQTNDARPERPSGAEGSQLGRKSFTIRTYEKSPSNPFRIRTSRTKDLKSFRIRSYEKTLYLSPLAALSLPFISCCAFSSSVLHLSRRPPGLPSYPVLFHAKGVCS
jgi:hypothetical protein